MKNHPNRPPVAVSVTRAKWLLRLRTELVAAGHIYTEYIKYVYTNQNFTMRINRDTDRHRESEGERQITHLKVCKPSQG